MVEQRSEEWRQQRLGKVTASRVVDIMPGVKGKYLAARENYMSELICELLTGEPAEGFTSEAMQWGIDTEPLARSEYEVRNDVMIEESGFVDHQWIKNFGGSPDGLVGEDGGIEIKCPNTATHIDTMLTGKVKRAYEYQIHANMMCTNRNWWDFFSFDPRLPDHLSSFTKRYHKDPQIEAEISIEIDRFNKEIEEKIKKMEELK